jgi:phosphate transport system substrate-binding protein
VRGPPLLFVLVAFLLGSRGGVFGQARDLKIWIPNAPIPVDWITKWTKLLRREHPDFTVSIEGRAGGDRRSPISVLLEKPRGLILLDRAPRPEEVEEFRAARAYPPAAVPVGALDAIAILVHADNPISSLSLPEVDAVFSKTRRAGHPKHIKTWGDLGLGGAWKEAPISIHGPISTSGTYHSFKEHALFKGGYKDEVKEHPGGSAVVQAVSGAAPAGS